MSGLVRGGFRIFPEAASSLIGACGQFVGSPCRPVCQSQLLEPGGRAATSEGAAVASGGKLGSVAERAAVARQRLAGRVGEIAAVLGLLEAAARHDGGAMLVSGEAGVGKTALVREASALTAARSPMFCGRLACR